MTLSYVNLKPLEQLIILSLIVTLCLLTLTTMMLIQTHVLVVVVNLVLGHN